MAPAFKRRKINGKHEPVQELTFDLSARQEYLTGFHKRKVARAQHAREAAIQRDKEERVRERRQLREQRKEELEQHVEAVNAEMKKQNRILNGDGESSSDEDDAQEGTDAFAGFEDQPDKPVENEEEEYVDEDKYTTVTVEAMGEPGEDEDAVTTREADEAKRRQASSDADPVKKKKKRPWAKDGADKAKVKKKKFRYESKAERSATRSKQKSKNSRAATARRTGG